MNSFINCSLIFLFYFRLNASTPKRPEIKNSNQNKFLQLEFESDSDPDVFFEFHPEIELNRAKSDSAIDSLKKYIASMNTFYSDSTSRECLDAEKTDILISIDSW